MGESLKILRFPNRKERRGNLAKFKVTAPAKHNGVEGHVISQDEMPPHGDTPIYDATVEELPRYLRRAFESRDEDRVVACLEKAQAEGWSVKDLTKAMHKFTRETSKDLN